MFTLLLGRAVMVAFAVLSGRLFGAAVVGCDPIALLFSFVFFTFGIYHLRAGHDLRRY